MAEHIGTVQAALRLQAQTDPLAGLRDALAPVAKTPAQAAKKRPAARKAIAPLPSTSSTPPPSDDGSAYLGALL